MNNLKCDRCKNKIVSKDDLVIRRLRIFWSYDNSRIFGTIKLLHNKCFNKKRSGFFREEKDLLSLIDMMLFFYKGFLIIPLILFFGTLIIMLLFNFNQFIFIYEKWIIATIILTLSDFFSFT